MAKKIVPVILILSLGALVIYYIVALKYKEQTDLIYGTVEATEVKLSAELMGSVTKVFVREGEKVKAGQNLVEIDHKGLDAQLALAKAARITASGQLNSVKATINNVKTNLVRSENLLDAGSISNMQFDSVDAQNRALKGQKTSAWGLIKQADAQIEYIKTQIEKAVVKATISGVVLQRSIEPGEMVMPGTPLFTLADIEHCRVRIYIPENELGKVKLGQKVLLYSDSYPEKTYEGKVAMISSEAEFTPKTVQTRHESVRLVYGVKVSVHNPDGELKIGMPVDARFSE